MPVCRSSANYFEKGSFLFFLTNTFALLYIFHPSMIHLIATVVNMPGLINTIFSECTGMMTATAANCL